MTPVAWLLLLAVAVQLAAAAAAFRLMAAAGRRGAWLLVGLAFLVMTARSILVLVAAARGAPPQPVAGPRDIALTLASSLLLLSGVAQLLPHLREPRASGVAARGDMTVALEESEEKFRSLTETAASAIFVYQGNRFAYVNPAAEELTGYSSDELLAINFWDVVHPEHRDTIRERGMARQRGERLPARYEFKIVRKDGETRWVDFTAGVIHYQGAVAALGTAFDITDRKLLEEQLRQAQKMETVGRLAGGIAHDLNNLLLPIMTAAELVQRRLAAEAPVTEELAIIRRTASRAAELTRGLLAFARRQVIQAVDLDIDQVIAGMLPMLRRLIPENVRIDYVPGHDLGTVSADPAQLEQVIINLAANARDAMPDGGTLTLETDTALVNGAYVATHPWANVGKYLMVRVSDDGVGMDRDTLAHIFEPFFTTKETGKGTGLGLATVYGIVKQHGGMIHAYSEPGHGSTFKVYLPVVRRLATQVGAKIEEPVRGGAERVLVVEDDAEVRRVLVEVLGGLGYRVSAAGDGAEALSLLSAPGAEVDLVVTDVVMPRMGGVELCRAAEKAAPRTRFLLSSGYSESVISEDFLRRRGAAFIAKPYGIDTLARKVRTVLDGNVTPGAGTR